MKGKIIQTAGKIWEVLGKKGKAKIDDLPKLIKEKASVVFQGLGWLAREDKINYSSKGKDTLVALIESEMQIFNTVFPKKQLPVKKAQSRKKVLTKN